MFYKKEVCLEYAHVVSAETRDDKALQLTSGIFVILEHGSRQCSCRIVLSSRRVSC